MLNKTNNRTFRGAYGETPRSWNGKIIVVFPTMVDMRGKMTPALRVRIPPPSKQQRLHLSPSRRSPARSCGRAGAEADSCGTTGL